LQLAALVGLAWHVNGFGGKMAQFLAMLFVLPLSRRAYRVANMIMMEALWSELIWLVDWWAGVKVGFFWWVCFVYGCSFQQSNFLLSLLLL
jgi:hypothetical protein